MFDVSAVAHRHAFDHLAAWHDEHVVGFIITFLLLGPLSHSVGIASQITANVNPPWQSSDRNSIVLFGPNASDPC